MRDLSILIPARNEQFLAKTVEDILKNKRGNTEVIVVLDGEWADPPAEVHPDVIVLYFPKSIGQRAAQNMAARLSTAKYVMKVDAHCAFDEGFDVKMMKEMQDDWTMVPNMKNLHAFDWVCKFCGFRQYQGPKPEKCPECEGTDFEKDVVWIAKKSPNSTSYCVNKNLQFKYFGEYKKKQKGDLVDTMSLQGSCFMCTREKYWGLNLCDESWGSWGQQGAEVALKTWLSGGRVVCNKKTWYAHMFRTQKGFRWPYPAPGSSQRGARKLSRDIFFNNKWEKQIHPFSWLLEKFWPVYQWTEEDLKEQKEREKENWKDERKRYFGKVETSCMVCGKTYKVKPSRLHKTKCCSRECLKLYQSRIYTGRKFTEEHKKRMSESKMGEKHPLWRGDDVSYKTLHQWVQRHKGKAEKCIKCGSVENVEWANKSREYKRDLDDWIQLCKKCHWKYDHPSRSIVFYTDNQLNVKIAKLCQGNLKKMGLPIVSVSLKSMPRFGKNIHLPLQRGHLAMFKQILAGLEASKADIVFFCEHDVLYHPSHFDFVPPKKDVFYYNTNVWKVRVEDGHALRVDDCKQTSGLCADRDFLLKHYRKRVKMVEKDGFSRRMGFEPGSHNRKERVDDYKCDGWESKYPNIDIRHKGTMTPTRWKKEGFRNQKFTKGWKESNIKFISGWGKSKFALLL